MIRVDLFYLALGVVLACVVSAGLGAWIWGRAVKRDALADKEWILKNTIFKDRLLIELRALEWDAVVTVELIEASQKGANVMVENRAYWGGKLQAFRDVIVKLGERIYGK